MKLTNFMTFALAYFYMRVELDENNLIKFPTALKVTDELLPSIKPEEVVIVSGGHSIERRMSSFANITAEQFVEFAKHNNYRMVFLDQVDYDRSMEYKSVKYRDEWQRVFAFPNIRRMFPDAKYFVWFDDDILVTFPETKMLNFYINVLERSAANLLFGDEGGDVVFNSGMIIMKNTDFTFEFLEMGLEIGLEPNTLYAVNPWFDQTALVTAFKRFNLESEVLILSRREGIHNFNNFARKMHFDPPNSSACFGDAFVHFNGHKAYWRELGMLAIKELEFKRQNGIAVDSSIKINDLTFDFVYSER